MIGNNNLAALTQQAPQQVTQAIQVASAETGVDFAYLMQQAKAESSFNPAAKAKTSSATGLYQFIEKTWLGMVRDHGHKHGMGEYAEKIDSRGRVSDAAARKEILALRKDPAKAAVMAAEFANENKAYLERHVGGDIGATELYFAHFLGAGGASGFLNAMKDDPMTIGAHILPKAAAANRNVFYDRKTGQPRTLAQIYDFFDKKFSIDNVESKGRSPYKASVEQVKVVNTNDTPKAYKTEGYQHVPPSLKAPITYENRGYTLAALQNLLNAPSTSQGYFGGSGAKGALPSSLYSRLVLSPVDILSLYKG